MLHDVDADGSRSSAASRARILDRAGFAGRLAVTGELDRALDGADAVLIQIRVGGQAARLRDETVPLACGCIGQETTGAGGFAKAMRTVPGRARDRRPGSRAGRATSMDRRLHQSGRDRHPGAARRRASGGWALQRRDRLPASFAALLGVDAGAGRRRPGRPQPPDLGPRGMVDGEDVLPELLAAHGRRSPPRSGSRVTSSTSSAPCRPTTCGTSTPTTRCSSEQPAASPGRRSSPRSSASCSSSTAIQRWREARAARAARRGVLQRGGDRPDRVAVRRRRRRPGGGRPQRRDHRRARRRRRGRGAGADRPRRGGAAPAAPAGARAARARPARCRLRAAHGRGGGDARSRHWPGGRCSPIR